MSYRKITPRPINVDLLKINEARRKFVRAFAPQIPNFSYLLSIDEWLINRFTYQTYAWAEKRKTAELN